MSNFTHPFNVYTSREDANGMIYNLSSPMWLVLLLYMLFLANALGWSIIGLVEMVEYVL